MNSSTLPTSFLHLKAPSFHTSFKSHPHFPIRASSTHTHNPPILQTLKTVTKAAILIGLSASFAARFSFLPAKAETSAAVTEQTPLIEEEENQNDQTTTPISQFLQSDTEAIESLKSLLQQKLDNGEDEEALKILTRLNEAQPLVTEWKFLTARLLNEMGRTQDARNVFEEILQLNPLSFEALFENALLMDRSGEGDAVIRRLQEALEIAEEGNKVKEARDVRFIMAQIQFLQKNVEEALRSYQELSKEDPSDFRPYFCRGMIYSLLDRNEEAREQFGEYRKLSPKKFEVEGYLQTPLSRMKLFGSNEDK
ncbi:protein SLOW GREEN 1, chloroplastic [Mercurialis annua]|uniref:protein SLOW GREEN 1, chloroplastic n=1 Tax=Mercurialis annua TaxID=3986 RepID=UPI00215F64E8|nr:protein SLOW GREEN 1, chloroplastic [Mercurialis annua]